MFLMINVGFIFAVKRVKRFVNFLVFCYFNFKYIYFNLRVVFEIKHRNLNKIMLTGSSSPSRDYKPTFYKNTHRAYGAIALPLKGGATARKLDKYFCKVLGRKV
jgi:hypothetical protein